MSVAGHCRLNAELLEHRDEAMMAGHCPVSATLPPARPRLTLHGPLDVGTAGEPQPALEEARKEGRPEQGKIEMQPSEAELSRTARYKFGRIFSHDLLF